MRCHDRVGHSGREKTWREVHTNYFWVRYYIISLFLQTCTHCSLRKPLKNRPCGKPIISLGFLTRCQVDLVDMISRPDQDFNGYSICGIISVSSVGRINLYQNVFQKSQKN